ncbi:Uu.00g119380.m01.CDS01 [Anthostomella pinea]|uniref:Uu.00g119380.m01.CDS01 n=1 Tax=Anthostomella pinea TaxID=933095 RepID=A0AAI8YH39_9PEZI|nr:Uu.00g119380.m01.CDS01 [Anthostomella pinea]
MEPHEQLLDWATQQGVQLNGIAPQRIPGRGIGLLATRAIKPEEIALEVPTRCLRSISTVPKAITRKLPNTITVHGLLAADLALDKTAKYDLWNAVCPSPDDLTSMPLVWPAELQALLPQAARELLSKQQAKFVRDWSAVSEAYPNLEETGYRYAWMLVNTRTFYYLNSKLEKRGKDDHMCLQPVADLFNHGDEGCNVSFDTHGFAIKALQPYAQGDEVKICYGRHSGDFLLVEYGFVMDDNRWDEVVLDDVVLPRLSWRQKQRLEEVGFLGKYILDRETVCYRTQVALRLLCCGIREWKRFVDGIDDGEASQGAVNKLLVEMLKQHKAKADEMVEEVGHLEIGAPEQRSALMNRWKQVRSLVGVHISSLEEAEAE